MKLTRFSDDFSREIYEATYKIHPDNGIEDTLDRVARALSDVEANPEEWFPKFRDVLSGFKFVTGGRVLSNAGAGLKGTSLINCFTSGPRAGNGPVDSMEGILSELRRQALTLKSEGGYGFCCDFMRPRGSFVEGIATESPGAVAMLDMWDTQSAVITQGSGKKSSNAKAKKKIRKGAMMVTMSCWHPGIEEFITAKRTPGKLTKFNMSVLVTDAFMSAVKNNEPWDLVYPDLDADKALYDEIWDGDLDDWISKGGKTLVNKTYKNANELWDIIMKSTYEFNDPGVLFVDTINDMDNLEEYISATNPCGEQPMSPHSICLLGSLNLTQYLNSELNDFDYDSLGKDIPTIIRMMDNVNDIAFVPLEEQKESLKNKRRIGLGYLGYGSALMLMGLRYGSKEALSLTKKLTKFVSNLAYQSSAILAEEKGPFPAFDRDSYCKSKFVKTLTSKTQKLVRKHGTRNSHLLSVQPTGNTAIVANNCSGGLEPIFLPEYIRTSIVSSAPEGLNVPTGVDFSNTVDSPKGWAWTKEGEESILRTEFEGVVYKLDSNRGLTKETVVCDYAVRRLKAADRWDPEAEWAATTTQLSIEAHIDTMAVFAACCDAAISKTINVPSDVSYDEFKDIYTQAFETGVIKGFTTYRAGTRTSVLAAVEDSVAGEEDGRIHVTRAPKRPKSLECDIVNISSKDGQFTICIGLLNGQPYEVFAFDKEKLNLPRGTTHGSITKTSRKKYNLKLDNGEIFRDIQRFFKGDEQEVVTRLISTGLRHGTPIDFMIKTMRRSHGIVVSYGRALARALAPYITISEEGSQERCPECDSEKYFFVEGCNKCSDCGHGACS